MREAVLSISDTELAALGIEELVSLCRDAGIREFEELACRGNGAVVQVILDGPLDEERLASLSYVSEFERVEEAEQHEYLIAFTAPGQSAASAEPVADLVGTCDPEVNDQGATMSLVGSQETISGAVSGYEDDGMSPDLRKLASYEGSDRPLAELTDRQREVIRTAWDMGYYDVPREVATEDVAAELDLDPSTVAEHLQRAERNLLALHLSAE